MHLCSVLALLASALGLFGVTKIGLKPLQTRNAQQSEGNERPWAQKRWEDTMRARRECKAKCTGDESCSEQCPKPWLFLREKCDTAKPIWDCHKQCGHDHACHEQCPLPQCRKAAGKVKAVLQCHGKCGDDKECHHTCGRPFSQFQAVCKSFDAVSACHKVCVYDDHACHADCPKISWPTASGDRHHGDKQGKFLQHGSWHHHEHGSWHDHEQGSWHNHKHLDWHRHEHSEAHDKPWAQQRWEETMRARRECKAKCTGDESCPEQCPKPWLFLREKCDTAKPIWDCHKRCGHNHACHEQCPLPQCPKAAGKVKAVLQCHGKCGDDKECHHTCGHPFSQFQAVCKSFGAVSACHKVCVYGDHACHANCPKISWPAANGDHRHHEFKHGKFPLHGAWHHREHVSWHEHHHTHTAHHHAGEQTVVV